ncbi:HNH endonuclease [Xanthomonas arboricola]|uniref:HNH endonuclease n=1 Tax=Xanthomonas arboricola TaxID=56448 RepID=UPI00118BB396|nr:hypothetical protein [Xanthomonas arboricola]QDS14700.1 hypothetical protein FPL04_02895 [Xanthomonas arboricola]
MTDPYHPPLTAFVYTPEERAAVKIALNAKDPWNHDANDLVAVSEVLRILKARLRDHHLERHNNTCCYCRSNLYGGGHFTIDREHILPKDKFREFTYHIENLSVACKRCNMQFKKRSIKFLAVDHTHVTSVPGFSAWFHFVHPNLDNWRHHLRRYAQQIDTYTFVTYKVVNDSAKGLWTWKFFALERLEVESFDSAQGVKALSEEDFAIMEQFRQAARNLP